MSRFRKIQPRAAAGNAFLLLLAFSLPIISGCSACGYLIGSAVDKRNERGHVRPKYHADKFEPGESIRVVKTDGALIEGRFTKIVVYDDSVYSRRYDRAKRDAVSNSVLPDLGDTVTVQYGSGKRTTGEFIGYDMYFLEEFEARNLENDVNNGWVESAYQAVNLRLYSESPPKRIQLEYIDSVAYGTTEATAGIFREPSQSGTLPLRSAIGVRTAQGEVTIPFDETARTQTFKKTQARWVFFSLGLAFDIAMVALAYALSDMSFGFSPAYSGGL